MSQRPSMDDYVDVAERLVEFRAKHPDGSLQQADLKLVDFAGGSWVVYTARAYRTPDDPRPGEGTAWEPVPGRTPFTRDSEVQNAETAAWGRAIMAALAADSKRGIASKQEVRNRAAELEAVEPITERTRGELFALFAEHKITDRDAQIAGIQQVLGRTIESRSELTEGEAKRVIASLRARGRA